MTGNQTKAGIKPATFHSTAQSLFLDLYYYHYFEISSYSLSLYNCIHLIINFHCNSFVQMVLVLLILIKQVRQTHWRSLTLHRFGDDACDSAHNSLQRHFLLMTFITDLHHWPSSLTFIIDLTDLHHWSSSLTFIIDLTDLHHWSSSLTFLTDLTDLHHWSSSLTFLTDLTDLYHWPQISSLLSDFVPSAVLFLL